jgi:hypothetical protein
MYFACLAIVTFKLEYELATAFTDSKMFLKNVSIIFLLFGDVSNFRDCGNHASTDRHAEWTKQYSMPNAI